VETNALSLRRRIALSIALTVAFYLLALVLIAVLAFAATLHLGLLIACGLAVIAILRGIVARRPPYEPPSPALTRAAQPELHAFLDDVAARAGDRPVDEVYLAHDVNAGVLEVPGGGLRRGRRRVLELGLPLLQVLDRDALAAVVAHEHGHYVGGDTRYSLWMSRTRAALGRTIARLSDTDRIIQSLMAHPFKWYAKLFTRITAAVSRRQELLADALAARTAGADAHARALVTLERAGLAFDAYVSQDLEPALGQGVHPPIAEGFGRMLAQAPVRDSVDAAIRLRLAEEERHPLDTHPTLADRLAAIGVQDPAAVSAASSGVPRAIELLRDLPALERGLLKDPDDLRAIPWEEVGDAAIAPNARAFAIEHRTVLDGHTVADAGRIAATPDTTAGLWRKAFPDAEPADDDERELAAGWVVELLTAATLHAAATAGLTVMSLPGEPYAIVAADREARAGAGGDGAGADAFRPGTLLAEIRRGEAPATAWTDRVGALGFAALPLSPAPTSSASLTGLEALEQRAAAARSVLGGDAQDGADGGQSLAGTGR
jgi:Zn-dependent protease with chaperone function